MSEYLIHHGVKGQRWGVRRYQNPDGSLTSAGKEKLSKYKNKEMLKLNKKKNRVNKKYDKRMTRLMYKDNKSPYRDTKKSKYARKMNSVETRHKIELGQYYLQEKEIKNMSFDDMRKEKRAVGMSFVKTALGLSLIGIAPFSPPSVTKWNVRADRHNKDLMDSKNK